MKLSQLSTDRVADVLVMITDEIQELLQDDAFVEKLQKIQKTNDKTKAVKFGMLAVFDVAIYLLKAHRQATWRILGYLDDKSVEEIGGQLLPVTIKQISDVLQDKEIFSFFTPSGQSEPETPSDT